MSPITCWLILASMALLSLKSQILVGSENISIPVRCRTEGRLTLLHQQGDKTIKHYLAFTEEIDSIDLKSIVSIGTISYPPTKYYSIGGNPTLTVNSDGSCTTIESSTIVIPELAWFVELLLPGVDLAQFAPAKEHHVGPSNFLAILFGLLKDRNFQGIEEIVVHRNIPCKVFRNSFQLPNMDFTTQIDIYKPTSGVHFKNLQSTYFSIKVTTTHGGTSKQTTSLIIDFFNVDSMDGDSSKLDRMKNYFNLPLASGCSEFLEQIQPEIEAKSFSLSYRQSSNSDSILVAYDHGSGFLRREKYSKSISIWDLNEDLMYHIDTNMTNILDIQADYVDGHQICSVLRVVDRDLGPAFRPYEKQEESLDVLKMIGATQVAYLGKGTARDLACSIYESILPEAPDLFALTSERKARASDNDDDDGDNNSNNNNRSNNPSSKVDRDYIVQFYLLQGPKSSSPKFGLGPSLTDESFWPAQILLYRRTKYSNGSRVIEFLDQLDVYDFFWSLDGWSKKNNELFMASECFDDEDEQLRLEVAIQFPLVHQEFVRTEDKILLPYNKYKLEFDLVNDIFALLQTSKIHLVQYELRLRPHHVDLNMIIGDGKVDKILTYFGPGTIGQQQTYNLKPQIFLTEISEEDCVAASSLIMDISLVVHCASTEIHQSTCLMLLGDDKPTIVAPDTTDPTQGQQPICQVYRLTSSIVDRKGTLSVDSNKSKLIGHKFDFVAQIPEGGARGEIIEGMVKNYEISHEMSLIVIARYMFSVPEEDSDHSQTEQKVETAATATGRRNQKRVRSIKSITYNSLGDCVKICNLDVNCRSYSYCTIENGNQCILSSLDIRASKLQDQLIHSPVQVAENKTITVDGADGRSKYELEFSNHCDIYERNYLNIFRQTEEIVRIERKLVNQFRVAPTTFDCAKQSLDLELISSNHHVAMFAYCPTSNTCLLDENLFTSPENGGDNNNNTSPSTMADSDELICKIYRKKYQTYFGVSAKVLKQQAEQQVELAFETVEECARACWNRFGQVCASFDYCSPKSCLINRIHMDSSEAELEIRPNCLHYERDLELDELRRQHMIGRHELLQEQKEVKTFGGILLSSFTYFLVFCAFVYGLVLGRQVNDKMEAVTILRQSVSAGPGQRARQMSGFMGGRFSVNYSNEDDDDDDDDEGPSGLETMPEQLGTNAIRLGVIKNRDGEIEPSDQDF